MRQLDVTDVEKAQLKNILSLSFLRPYDPNISYSIDAVAVPDSSSFRTVVSQMGKQKEHIYFSAINGSRDRVIKKIMQQDSFPAGEFCAPTPKTVMQFLRGHRLPVNSGTTGSICILRDRHPEEATSPSVINLGKGEEADRIRSYYKTSHDVVLIAVIRVKITGVSTKAPDVTASALKRKQKKRKGAPEFADEVEDDRTKRKLRKIRRKRMDNFGIKEDY